MKKLIFLLVILPNILLAQKKAIPTKATTEKSSTVNKDGWRDLKWGATFNEVKSKYNTTDYDKENNFCTVENYELVDRKFKLIFHFDSNSNLNKVVLGIVNYYLGNDYKFRWAVRDEIGKLQNDIENGLAAKFGSPSFTSNAPEYIRDWNFQNLKIEIKSSISYRPKLTKGGSVDHSEKEDDLVFSDSFTIVYSKPNKSSDDKF